MSEERLYKLAHEALLERRSKLSRLCVFVSNEKELWNELLNLESEMKLKGIK